MFFNRHIKQGKEAGSGALTFIEKSFYNSKYHDGMKFTPPHDLFDDMYIYGFCSNFITTILNYVIGGKKWDYKKKVEFIQEAFYVIDPTGNLLNKHLEISNDNNLIEELKVDKNFIPGNDAALNLVGVLFGIFKEDDPDPMIIEAKQIADSQETLYTSIGIYNDNPNVSIATAVAMLSLFPYVKKEWH